MDIVIIASRDLFIDFYSNYNDYIFVL